LLVPLAALMLSDYAVIHFLWGGRYAWFSPYTWTGFLLVGLIGWTLRSKLTVTRTAGACMAGSVVFFLVSNVGVWAGWKMYPASVAGLIDCYVAALPFFRNTVIGDLIYAGMLFGAYAWIRRRRAAVALRAAS